MTDNLKFSFAASPEGFDNHINNSIMGYSDMTNMVMNMSDWFIEKSTGNYLDIGCSSGKLVADMAKRHKNGTFVGIDYEDSFGSDWAKNIDDVSKGDADVDCPIYIPTNAAEYLQCRAEFGSNELDYITSIFTLQFMTQKERLETLSHAYDVLRPGGAFIVAEKLRSENSQIHEMMTFMFYDYKRKNFTAEQILDKEKTLRSMLRPYTENSLIIDLVEAAGFRDCNISCFWKNYQFAGFICIKDSY